MSKRTVTLTAMAALTVFVALTLPFMLSAQTPPPDPAATTAPDLSGVAAITARLALTADAEAATTANSEMAAYQAAIDASTLPQDVKDAWADALAVWVGRTDAALERLTEPTMAALVHDDLLLFQALIDVTETLRP